MPELVGAAAVKPTLFSVCPLRKYSEVKAADGEATGFTCSGLLGYHLRRTVDRSGGRGKRSVGVEGGDRSIAGLEPSTSETDQPAKRLRR